MSPLPIGIEPEESLLGDVQTTGSTGVLTGERRRHCGKHEERFTLISVGDAGARLRSADFHDNHAT